MNRPFSTVRLSDMVGGERIRPTLRCTRRTEVGQVIGGKCFAADRKGVVHCGATREEVLAKVAEADRSYE